MWNKIWSFVRTPMEAWGKKAARKLVSNQLEKLRTQAQAAFAQKGVPGVDRIVDGFQAKAISGVGKVTFLPEAFRERLSNLVQTQGDALQAKLDASVTMGGSAAIDAAFAFAQAEIDRRLDP